MAIYRERNFVHAARGRGDITKVDEISAFSERYSNAAGTTSLRFIDQKLIDWLEYDNAANQNPDRRRKRRRLYSDGQETQANQGPPSDGGRGMKNFPLHEGMANDEI